MMSKKRLSIISILFLLIINLCSCGTKVIVRDRIVYLKPVYCYKPPKPKYQKLNPNLGLTSSQNLNILVNNIIELKTYSQLLENTIECYELQIKQFEELSNATSRNK